MIVVSFAEIISIGAIIPFLGILSDPLIVYENQYFKPFLEIFKISQPSELIIPFTALFIFAVLLSGSLRILLTLLSTKLSFATGADIGADIYKKTLHQPYSEHALSNSSEVINGIVRKTDFIMQNIILQTTVLVSSAFFLVIILVTLLYISPVMAASLFTGFGFVYFLIISFSKSRLLSNGKDVAEKTDEVMKNLQESFGGIKDVILDGSQEKFYNLFRRADVSLRKAQANTTIIVSTPKFAIESLGMSIMALTVLFFSANVSSLNSIIPTLGALALGGQKLLPVLQQGYSAWSSLRGGQALLEDVVDFLETEYEFISYSAKEKIEFSQQIEIINVNFRHKGSSSEILENLNLIIPKGSIVGFIGETGRGKTTFLDIIMGLLEPSSGEVLIDNKALTKKNMRSWQERISHVPQNIFLSDDSIKNNIAFGVPNEEVDESRVKRALEKSYLAEYVNSLPDKEETYVGERGARLSGGQRQRLGIARALYKNIDLVVFDEATSSLDALTEEKVMDEIAALDDDLTLLIIAHRVTTLKTCDFIVNLTSSGMEILKYEDIQKI